MEKVTIGVEKRISMGVLELALRAVLEDNASNDYFYELAHTECEGANRAKKIVALLNRLTLKSKLLPFLKDNKDAVLQSLRAAGDRPLIFVGVMCAAYTIFYDTVAICGKFFHVQDQISRDFLLSKLAEKYGSNRTLFVAFDCVLPMLIEAGFIARPQKGCYEMCKQEKGSDFAKTLYRQAFLLNNPTYTEADDTKSAPYFEYLN